MKSFITQGAYIITVVLPSVALAASGWGGGGGASSPDASGGSPDNLAELIKVFTDLINPLIGLLTGVAVLLFIWGIVQYIFYASDEKKKVSAKDTMVYGIIALFVLFSFWSIVQLLKNSIFG